MVNPFSIFFSKFDSRGHNCPFWPPSDHFGGHIISIEHSYRHGYRIRGKSTRWIHSYYSYVINISIDDTFDLFDRQVVILEVILCQWSTHTVMANRFLLFFVYACWRKSAEFRVKISQFTLINLKWCPVLSKT